MNMTTSRHFPNHPTPDIPSTPHSTHTLTTPCNPQNQLTTTTIIIVIIAHPQPNLNPINPYIHPTIARYTLISPPHHAHLAIRISHPLI
ncbi:unnamed protein product [Periconia digitata]|uniref:Uncharacterized protein n=1 Tax=Periconia digitata TaxID=1303443 RepID=A0A9W4UNH1_9PLEO|nr:unnamed protein product [Periconia digitata]